MNSCNRFPLKPGDAILKGVLAWAVLSPAMINAATEFDKQAYIGAGFGLSNFSLLDTNGVELQLTESNSSAGHLVLGRDFSPRLTGEFHYHDMGKASLDVQSSVAYTDLALSGLIYLYGANQYRSGLSVYTRLGIGQIETEGTIAVGRDHPVHLIAGAGVEYATNSGIALRADYIHHDEDAMSGSLTLLYRFGADRNNSISEPPMTLESAETTAPNNNQIDELPAQVEQQPEELPELPVLPDLQALPELPVLAELPVLPSPSPTQLTEPVYPEFSENSPGIVTGESETIASTPATSPQPNPNDSVYWVEQSRARVADPVITPTLLDIPIESLNFLIASTELTGRSIQILEEVSNILLQNPELRLEIASHTDNQGDPAENLDLSKRRAVSVAKYLYSWGIDVSRIQALAYGGKRPLASNDTIEGRQTNRRVELRFKAN